MSIPFLFVLVGRLLRLRISSRTGSSQQSPALCLLLAPSATPRYSPMSDARRVYFVDSFIAHGSQLHAHTKSLVSHLSRSHLQWLANCSHSNGGRQSPSLHLTRFYICPGIYTRDSARISVYFFCYMEIRLYCSESQLPSLCMFFSGKSPVSISLLVYILKYRLPSARYYGFRMHQNLVQ